MDGASSSQIASLVIREHQVYLQVVKDGFPDDTNDRSSFNVKRQKFKHVASKALACKLPFKHASQLIGIVWKSAFYDFYSHLLKQKASSTAIQVLLDECRGFFQRVLGRIPQSQDQAHIQCLCLNRLGDVERYQYRLTKTGLTSARDAYMRAIDLYPANGTAWNQLGLLAMKDTKTPHAFAHTVYLFCRSSAGSPSFPAAKKSVLGLLQQTDSQFAKQANKTGLGPVDKTCLHHFRLFAQMAGITDLQAFENNSNIAVTSWRECFANLSFDSTETLCELSAISMYLLATSEKKHQNQWRCCFHHTLSLCSHAFESLEKDPESRHTLELALMWLKWCLNAAIVSELGKRQESEKVQAMIGALTRALNVCSPQIAADERENLRNQSIKNSMSGFPLLFEFKPSVDDDTGISERLLDQDAAGIQCLTLRTYAQELVRRLPDLITFDSSLGLFFVGFDEPEGGTSIQNTHVPSDRGAMMKKMAQLRLKDQVQTLEKQVQDSERPASTAKYILPDTLSVANSLYLIQELLNSGKYQIVVTKAIILGMDVIKKGDSRLNKGARDANRFLQEQADLNHPNLIFQKDYEEVLSPVALLPHEETGMTKEFYLLLQASRFYVQQLRDARAVVILSNEPLLTQAAQAENLSIASLSSFHSDFKALTKGSASIASKYHNAQNTKKKLENSNRKRHQHQHQQRHQATASAKSERHGTKTKPRPRENTSGLSLFQPE